METGISLMELDCLSLEMVISMSIVVLRELTYVVGTMLTHQLLVSIAVIFTLMLSMMIVTSQCITDLDTCCSRTDGSHRGDWYFPNGTRLPFSGGGIYERRGSQRVDLRRRNNATSPTVGIYRCGIPTNAVYDATDISVRDTVYVGLYTSSGGMLLMVLW